MQQRMIENLKVGPYAARSLWTRPLFRLRAY